MAFVDLRKTGKLSDISVRIEGKTMKLHKFPLISRSRYFDGLVSSNMIDSDSVTLVDLPGGVEAFDVVVDFCYGIDVTSRITCANVGPLVCAASYLSMTDAHSPGNLLAVAQKRLDAITSKNVATCLKVLNGSKIAPNAEIEGVVEKCCSALANSLKELLDVLSEEEIKLVRELPRDWVLTLLAKLKEASAADGALLVALAYVRWPACPSAKEELLQPILTPKGRVTFFEALVHLVLPDAERAHATDTVLLDDDVQRDRIIGWFFHALLFADIHELDCRHSLLKECAHCLWEATISHCIDYPPDLLADVNLMAVNYQDTGTSPEDDDSYSICLLNEKYLLHYCRRGTIGTDGFHKIMSSLSQLRRYDACFTVSFEALESLLESSVGKVLTEKDIVDMAKLIDFSKLSIDCLKRAASHSRIPKEVILPGAVRLCELNDQRVQALVQISDLLETMLRPFQTTEFSEMLRYVSLRTPVAQEGELRQLVKYIKEETGSDET